MGTKEKKPSLLASAVSSANGTNFDLKTAKVVKQELVIRLVKVLPNSPSVARLFESSLVNLVHIKTDKSDKIYAADAEVLSDADMAPYVRKYVITSGRTAEGTQFLAYCQYPDEERPNRFHVSGVKAMQLALEMPVSRKPFEEGDDAYSVLTYTTDHAEVPEIKEPDYDITKMFELALGDREVLTLSSAPVLRIKALTTVQDG